MAGIEPSDPSLVAPVAVTPIQTIALEAGGLGKGEHGVIDTFQGSSNYYQEEEQSTHVEDGQRSNHALSQSKPSFNSDGIKEDGLSVSSDVVQQVAESTTISISLTNVDPNEKLKHGATGPNTETISSIPSTVSNSPVQQHSSYPPQLKRFTSANVTKRFLEKTSSTSGPSLGATAISNTNPVLGSSSQRRGISPNSRSPSFDRPVSSRLVTAKLTAVSQPSSASATGWLRPGQATNTNTTPTPPSTSPQPPSHEFNTASLQTVKRRPGTSPAPNGISNAIAPQNNKLVWSRVTPASSKGSSGLENQNDFPTAAEAVHSMQTHRKLKPGKGETEPETAAAAHRTAQRNALNETAAAFRGAHLNTNTPHWDEMSDEDSEDFDGVIEFGDGTQYKIEQKPNALQEPSQERPKTPSESEGLPVTKEERFGEDMGRNWPRESAPLSTQPAVNKPSLQLSVSQQSASESPSQTQSPHDSNSPISRVLFNERLNRLEPLSESKAPYGSRQRESSFSLQTSNIQLLQKGLPGADFKNKVPPRGFGSNTERTPWGDNAALRSSFLMKDEERAWESRRRESMSSAAGSSIRDRSRGRESRWEPPPQYTIDRDRDNTSRASNAPPLPSSLTRERDGNRGTQFRAPFAPTPSSKGSERDIWQSNLSNTSPAISARSLHSPVLEKTQTIDITDDLDKNALLKDAMHLANERARRRKQELDEEEKRRAEAAERARKKAEALALAMEGKKVESQSSSKPSTKLISGDQTELKPEVTMVPTEIKRDSRERLVKPLTEQSPSLPPPPSRRPTTLSPATQADSWRNKAYLKTSTAESQVTESMETIKLDPLVPPKNSVIAPPIPLPAPPPPDLHELSIKPDEQVEIVDFEDLGRFLGHTTQETTVSTKPTLKFSKRPVASDFFKDDTVEPEAKNDGLSWRRPTVKLQSTPVMEGLRTQTVPIFPVELSPEVDPLTTEPKGGQSPPMSPSRRLSYGDQVSHSPQISPVLSLRSPRISHFKEAPMSALTDTMSRIKGALDGMQYQDTSKLPAEKPKLSSTELSRASRDDVFKPLILATPSLIPEEFVTRPPPPVSPRPVWNTYAIKVPKVSQQRDPLTRKQLHYFNLPYPPIRWDILLWDPPVEGMNKRDLSRDEIFHKRSFPRNGKLRVSLPRPNYQQAEISQISLEDSAITSTTVVTDAGVKIKLPTGPSTFRPAIITSPLVSTERPRDLSNVPSWRRSANPLTSLKKEQVSQILVTNGELSTTSRSPPPDPSTPLPQFTPIQKEAPTKLNESSRAATVSLPSTDLKLTDSFKGPREPVSFHRLPDPGSGGRTSTKPLPSFTVNSELESSISEPSEQTVKAAAPDKAPSEMDMKPVFPPILHEAPETSLPRLIASKPGSKSSEESTTRPETPPLSTQQQASSPWGKVMAFPVVKDSPTRRVPDPEHLKAVWSQPTSLPAGNSLNLFKGITDDLPFIPSAVQDMKSEDGETPPPTAPAPPSRLSQQEVARAFQQVPESSASRPSTYPHNPFLSQHHRPNHPMIPPAAARSGYPSSYHPHSVMGHSPSPTLIYAPSMASPVPHQRIPVSGPSPPITSGVWLPTPPPVPSQPGNYLRPAGVLPPPPQMAYPSPGSAPNQMLHHRIPLMAPGSLPPAPQPPQGGGLYTPAQMHHDMRNMHMRSPHMTHATAAHPHAVPMQPMQTMHHPMFSPPPPGHLGQPQPMYALPVGAGRGAMMPRNGYEAYPGMTPSAGYPNAPYMFQS
ncbi:hypothetical protein Clacol_003818 [Clathrus columnatus]|uniref:Uncharacterized protein n=1 Tax=Clathrus columnatus TaxID=1419009 RepID=A0AAV5ACE1_9AGAM|nr:hypothetical protein Clacol_003818 [Clathrus columnatus]